MVWEKDISSSFELMGSREREEARVLLEVRLNAIFLASMSPGRTRVADPGPSRPGPNRP